MLLKEQKFWGGSGSSVAVQLNGDGDAALSCATLSRGQTDATCTTKASQSLSSNPTTFPSSGKTHVDNVVHFNLCKADEEEELLPGALENNSADPRTAPGASTVERSQTLAMSAPNSWGCPARHRTVLSATSSTNEATRAASSMLQRALLFLGLILSGGHVGAFPSRSYPEGADLDSGEKLEARACVEATGPGPDAHPEVDPGRHGGGVPEQEAGDAGGDDRNRPTTSAAPEEVRANQTQNGHRETALTLGGPTKLAAPAAGLRPSSRVHSAPSGTRSILVHMPSVRKSLGTPRGSSTFILQGARGGDEEVGILNGVPEDNSSTSEQRRRSRPPCSVPGGILGQARDCDQAQDRENGAAGDAWEPQQTGRTFSPATRSLTGVVAMGRSKTCTRTSAPAASSPETDYLLIHSDEEQDAQMVAKARLRQRQGQPEA